MRHMETRGNSDETHEDPRKIPWLSKEIRHTEGLRAYPDGGRVTAYRSAPRTDIAHIPARQWDRQILPISSPFRRTRALHLTYLLASTHRRFVSHDILS